MADNIFISIGSNLDDPLSNCREVIKRLESIPLLKVLKVSSFYETEPWGVIDEQDNYINFAIELETDLSPNKLLVILKGMEVAMGRESSGKWEARLIDLDIIFYGTTVLESPMLTIPHPYCHQRRFVLEPLSEIAPDFVHPLMGCTVSELLGRLGDDSMCNKLAGD